MSEDKNERYHHPGFLTPTQRKYLDGERDIEEHANPSVLRRRIRDRVAGYYKDWELLNQTDLDWHKPLRDKSNPHSESDEVGMPAENDEMAFNGMKGQLEALEAEDTGEALEKILKRAKKRSERGELGLENLPHVFAEDYIEILSTTLDEDRIEVIIQNFPTKDQLRDVADIESE